MQSAIFETQTEVKPLRSKNAYQQECSCRQVYMMISLLIVALHITAGILDVIDNHDFHNWFFLIIHIFGGLKEFCTCKQKSQIKKSGELEEITGYLLLAGIIISSIHILSWCVRQKLTQHQYVIIFINIPLLLLTIAKSILFYCDC